MAEKKYQVQTYVNESTKNSIDKLCTKYQESVSSIVRRALVKFLEMEEKNNGYKSKNNKRRMGKY